MTPIGEARRREIRTMVTADVNVEVWIQHEIPDDRIDLGQAASSPRLTIETRKLKVSLSEQLDSSSDIREAFARLAEIAVQGATRA